MSPADTAATALAVLAALVVAGAAILAVRARRSSPARGTRRTAPDPQEPPAVSTADGNGRRPLAAVVVNPTKFADVAPLRAAMEEVCDEAGWAPLLWLESTADDPGRGAAREALGAGADLVAACGGDGTVRSVAEALAGTGTAMGLVPAGTGNLLARNLDVVTSRAAEIAPGDAAAALRVALTGEDRTIDVGWVAVEGGGDEAPEEEKAFLVMAGMGFDAAIMANAPEALKAKVGPLAYLVTGLRHFLGDRIKVTVDVDGERHERRVRTVVVGNVGRLQGGLSLMPDAEVDDGYLDAIAIGPHGLLGWVDVAVRLITRRRRGDRRLVHWRGRRIDVRTDSAQPVQVDGDAIGEARGLLMRVDPGALRVRVARGARSGPDRARDGARASGGGLAAHDGADRGDHGSDDRDAAHRVEQTVGDAVSPAQDRS